jgi:hypothetical protein
MTALGLALRSDLAPFAGGCTSMHRGNDVSPRESREEQINLLKTEVALRHHSALIVYSGDNLVLFLFLATRI